uniref:Uncharacterized protein n=1 Tax=Panstrongylus lignarius TaxID=156445 RepID=A0A224XUD9_9HEMI
MIYGTLSPNFGAEPASLFFILLANSTCACLAAYSVFVNSLVITSCDISKRLHKRSLICCLAYFTAPSGSPSIRSFCKQVFIILATRGQLSLLNVPKPLQSILS